MPKNKPKNNKVKPNNSLACVFAYQLRLFSCQTNNRRLQCIFPSRDKVCIERKPLGAMPIEIDPRNMLRLAHQGTLCMMLLQRLLCEPSQNIHNGLKSRLARYVLCRFHKDNTAPPPPCIPVNLTHNGRVLAVAFNPNTGGLITGCKEKNTKTVNIFNLQFSLMTPPKMGHFYGTKSVAFDSSANAIATVGEDNALKIWHLSSATVASCSATFICHSKSVNSVAVHPTFPLLATGSDDKTAKLWYMWGFNCSFPKRVETLNDHSGSVKSVAFHQILPFLATSSDDKTVKLYLISANGSSVNCVATLDKHSGPVNSVAFHPTLPLLATGSDDKTVKLWWISVDDSSVKYMATLKGHTGPVLCVAFHNSGLFLATGSGDNTAKLWRLTRRRPTSSRMTAICVNTLVGHRGAVNSVAFHPTAPLVVTGSDDNTAKLWR
jgi:WD40 repeat protein